MYRGQIISSPIFIRWVFNTLVKCRICNNKIERNDAYKIINNGKNEYYCNEKEYKQKQKQIADKANIINLINEIFGYEVANLTIHKELKDISEKHSYEKISSFLYNNKEMLERNMKKSFSSEYGKIRYFTTIIRNNIVDYIPIEDEPYITNNEYEVLDIKYKPKKKRRAMCDLERELLDG